MDRYQYIGIGFTSFGLPFAMFSYFVLLNIPMAALGLSCIILGGVLLLVPPSPLPSMQIRAMLEGSLVNIEAVLEEFDVLGKAVYLPGDSRVHAVIPVQETELRGDMSNIPLRVLTRVGGDPCILVFPPGSELVRLSLLPEDISLEDALSMVLVDFVELVDSVKAVFELDKVIVHFGNPRVSSEYSRVNNSLGSSPVSVAGCILSSVLGKAIDFRREEAVPEGIMAVFGVLDWI